MIAKLDPAWAFLMRNCSHNYTLDFCCFLLVHLAFLVTVWSQNVLWLILFFAMNELTSLTFVDTELVGSAVCFFCLLLINVCVCVVTGSSNSRRRSSLGARRSIRHDTKLWSRWDQGHGDGGVCESPPMMSSFPGKKKKEEMMSCCGGRWIRFLSLSCPHDVKKSSKHKKKKQKKEKEEKDKKKKKKHHHHHHHHSDGGGEGTVHNGTVEEEEPLPVSEIKTFSLMVVIIKTISWSQRYSGTSIFRNTFVVASVALFVSSARQRMSNPHLNSFFISAHVQLLPPRRERLYQDGESSGIGDTSESGWNVCAIGKIKCLTRQLSK